MKRTPYYSRAGITLYCGDSLEVAPEIDAESVSAVVTDPPYGLGFMGKAWDHAVPGVPFWRAFMHAMKPGAHLLAFGGSRTYHRMGVAIEDAGLELRDTLMWLYGSGFPKSHDVSKAIDKAAGAEREVVGSKPIAYPDSDCWGTPNSSVGAGHGYEGGWKPNQGGGVRDVTAPATPEAAQWAGWGTALKPAHEPIILARKPLVGTVAANVLRHGTGALNIDACRIPGDVPSKPQPDFRSVNGRATRLDAHCRNGQMSRATGRWPANVILDEDAAQALDAQSGELASNSGKPFRRNADKLRNAYGAFAGAPAERGFYGDTGGASRFFYVAKASRKERNAGLDGMPERDTTSVYENGNGLSGRSLVNGEWVNTDNPRKPKANHHPTVKPLALMRYLITLVTPPGGIVLDPFAGSGSTLVACAQLGFPAIGIELSEEYCEIIARRVDHALNERPAVVQPSLLEMVAD